MDKTKQTLAIALVAVLTVLAGGWFLLVSPQRSNVSTLNGEKATQDQTNATLQTKISTLKGELVELPAAKAALESVARRLPPDLAEVSLIQSLTHAAAQANVDLQIITPGSPILDTVAAPAAPVVAPTATGSATAAAVPAAAAAPANQLYSIPLGLTVSGDYFDLEMFIHNLEGMQRAVLVSNITLTGGSGAVAATATAAAGATGSAGSAGTTSAAGTTSGGKTKTSATTGKTGGTKVSKIKPVPGSAAAAQNEAKAVVPFVPNVNTLTLTVSASVFSMFSTAPAAAPITAAPTSASTK
jgi:Tfp pilus assembly protein PilO